MQVKDAKPREIIQVMIAGSYDPDSSYYLITSYQDVLNKVRAYKSLGGNITYLHPENTCRVITQDTTFGHAK